MSSAEVRARRARAGCALALLAALAGTTACGQSGTPRGGPAATSSATAGAAEKSATARPPNPVEVCTSLVGYWVKEALRGSKWAGIDWEQKGLSNERFELHDKVLAEARAEQKKNGTAAAEKLADRRIREECVRHNGATGSSENWREPTP
ncbi:hypothetical protein [Streptomyces sp. NPDC051561]|uniref:hypothetical protein n=1 Tax=Streptomyces sp. NPDC051561 TaxID=3365658 RepID=UPI00379F9F2E